MKFTNRANLNMTGLRGYVNATFNELVEVFGLPDAGPNADLDKTTCEWRLKFEDGVVASIYDYKQYMTPMGAYEWHIGGFDEIVVARIQEMVALNRDKLVKMVKNFTPSERVTG